MDFPVYIFGLHPHFLLESLAYFIGFRVYLWTKRPSEMTKDTGMWIVVGVVLGAAAGSKILYWLEDPGATVQHWNDPVYLLQGKTIVGALIGGLIGVELTKKLVGWKSSTGDDFVLPLIVGMMIGRIGCFLTGVEDHTFGMETSWITGMDLGDGVRRHPTALYEIAFLLLLLSVHGSLKKRGGYWEGFYFQVFMFSYFLFRFLIDFIKPTPDLFLMMNNVQWACLFGMLYYANLMRRKSAQTERGMFHA
ncbi:diacylglyceryl transferase [Bacillus sp. FJAT-42376]|uniref:prolipoprotein diacylglyceryl transferase n=1 Tax=Bacillus sp. FJAT-42376 TaxID=2014076 RepID=UPI000F5176F2|nr:prolipoprotein diacylglyceryl transferase family protein [Bacillus sp. FJAT-42376]AZB44270.1 diacylglyceryl transferase [Bacillus sp. FJAT-42376]